jgi:enamine deaminase RidA (YjgF/YER057c/UK114 family)
MSISARLNELGLVLPEPPKAVAAYIPALITGNLCFTAGQLPLKDGKLVAEGRVGADVTPEDAYQAARQSALNAISVAAQAAGGVDRLKRVVKVVGFVQSDDGFHGQPGVINGASELFESVFGEAGRHARSAVGTNALPLNAAVEVEAVFEVGE